MKLKPYTAAPFLAALVYLLTLCAEQLIASLDMHTNSFLLAAGAIQLGTYLLPLLLYGLLFGGISARRMRLSLPTAVSLPLQALLGMILLLGTALLSLLFQRLGITGVAESTVIGEGVPKLLIIAVFAVIPAVCEELIFRGVILSAFEPCGVAPAIIGTSLLFAFAHMSFEKLPIYFFASVILCFAAYTGRSLLASMLLHTLYNIVSLYLGEYLSGIAAHLESFSLLFVVMLFTLWIVTLIALAEGERVYRAYAERDLDSSYTPKKLTHAQRIKGSASVYFSIPFLLCTLIYIAVIVLSLQDIA
ncbi:MAG: CPBP family intramembrane metalloprotease [Clostridia bacterium]|nr:CPBP family intramembrane metalloprotease [Clostridia bacterium]